MRIDLWSAGVLRARHACLLYVLRVVAVRLARVANREATMRERILEDERFRACAATDSGLLFTDRDCADEAIATALEQSLLRAERNARAARERRTQAQRLLTDAG